MQVSLSNRCSAGRLASSSTRPVIKQSRNIVRRFKGADAAYVAPSSASAASELEALAGMSHLVPDTMLLDTKQQKPEAATVSASVLHGILHSETLGMKPYENAITHALNYDRCKAQASDARINCQIDKAMVNVGAMFAEEVSGRVCTEVDPRLANNADALVARTLSLCDMYREMGLAQERLIFRLPATWQGIQACRKLEAQGVATQIFLVYSEVQGVAAAQAGASVLQPNVGRVRDWYARHPGAIRDPHGPREDSGYASRSDPGRALVAQLYNYVAKHHGGRTKIMASGLRSVEDALALAGCDYLICGPKVLAGLAAMPTAQGYNDGLSAASGQYNEGLERQLSPAGGRASEAEAYPSVTQQLFEGQLGLAGSQLLKQGLAGLSGDVEAILPYFRRASFGTD